MISSLSYHLYSKQEYIVYHKSVGELVNDRYHDKYIYAEATIDDIGWICDQRKDLGSNALKTLLMQFNNNDINTIIYTNSRKPCLLFIAWVCYNDILLKILGRPFNGAEASLRRLWVPFHHRGKGIAKLGLAFTEQVAMKRKINHLWSIVKIDNVPSRKIHDSLRYTMIDRLKLYKIYHRKIAKTISFSGKIMKYYLLPRDFIKF